MKKIFYHGLIMLGMITLTFTACKKDKQITDDSSDIAAVDENAKGDETFSDIFIGVSSYSNQYDASFTANTKSNSKTLSELAVIEDPTITITPLGMVWPKTVTFDYGTGITVGGVTRKGKIIAIYSDRFKNKDAVVTITLENFYVNDTKIEGTKTITNKGKNLAGNYEFKVVVDKSKINDVKGIFSYNANRTIEWTKGEATANYLDDEFSITGRSNGVNFRGVAYATNITKPLIKKVAWPYLVSGIIEIKPSDKLLRILDYGNGVEDAKATLTINGISKEFYLRK